MDPRRLPRHVAIIMDGNGRWAKRRHLPRHAGHRAGVEAVRMSVEQCARLGVEVLTLFAFSSENWQRPKQEVSLLMELFMTALHREVRRLNANHVRLRVVGDRSAFPEKLRTRIAEAEALTGGNDGLVLQIAANYGGRWDITQAARRLAVRVLAGDLRPEAIDDAALADELSFADLPDPDLFIRTGGERRLSNFVLWQAAYAELYFTDCLWPDFGEAELAAALSDFAGRQRRFGRTGDQIEGPAKGSAEG
ncbi:MAG: isoprenyl transferase [Chromatiales bacterium]|jgi:undecaprenyl diphosphate synthase